MNIIELFEKYDEKKHKYAINSNFKDHKYYIYNGALYHKVNNQQCYMVKDFFDGWSLVNKTKRVKGWINVYKRYDSNSYDYSKFVFETEEEALRHKDADDEDDENNYYVNTISVSWEEK